MSAQHFHNWPDSLLVYQIASNWSGNLVVFSIYKFHFI